MPNLAGCFKKLNKNFHVYFLDLLLFIVTKMPVLIVSNRLLGTEEIIPVIAHVE